ncbi:MAG: exodeoxyribonuclease VII small subunit [Armatimonadetes bacterium CG_4_10_14_3_um_filter_66_18]|nr:exodeoxyribonuclease VII small subunit [Armatimonadota bacterium]OIP12065.1 MAG: exodeoxyribonuclease VII small subunit [Armatimonadetes bacterium CG2_30_66_41]PIU90513.1 MAG: exodeoxyribonuclease VII small subunit [Armatimonadetes bacterium CG06_land_8_20_14_3_00_66_21]PIX49151.1 MAG: exodeoxyribonuclease VII small subunit [Armatimonadetes bacterium CG_4_8_14_3_um_filter_66_20]PIY48352.1 MAG: exodeoxyribonuclease VII small subunit [Armatimonadetes bacterium CG_4_10_14_3_um_filter_66_18]PIZ
MSGNRNNATTQTDGDAQPRFDEALTQLETLVRKLESGDLKLEEAIATFEEGMRLSKVCERQLNAAETRLRELIVGDDGEPEEQPASLPENADAPR